MNMFRAAVESLAMLPGVRGAVIAAPDGVIIDCVVRTDVRADALAAFGSSLWARARAVAAATSRMRPTCVAIDAEAGRLYLASNDDVAIVVLAEPGTSTGRLRIALRLALESLA